jgi:hypothetical protein
MSSARSVISYVVALVVLAAADAQAQTVNRFALGPNVTSQIAPDADSRGNTHIGLQWRIGHGDEGWGWKYGLNWYSTRIDGLVAGRTLEIGELHVRPIMAGYGYTRVLRKTAVSANLLAGYAFGGFSLDAGARALYRAIDGTQDVDTHAGNTFVLKPEISAWRDLSRKVGLHAGVGYMVARPELSVATAAGLERRRVRADMLQLKIGAVYSIF